MSRQDLIEVVDENDRKTGDIVTRGVAHDAGLRHRIAAMFVFSQDGRLYVQVRGDGGLLDHTVGGHVDVGESYEQAAKREMLEEVGLSTPLKLVSESIVEDCSGTAFAPVIHMINLYKTSAPKAWVFEPNDEVPALKLMDVEQIVADMKRYPDKYTIGFMKTMEAYLQ